jgi:hypothetical protein
MRAARTAVTGGKGRQDVEHAINRTGRGALHRLAVFVLDRALAHCLRMIFSENRCAPFRIMR